MDTFKAVVVIVCGIVLLVLLLGLLYGTWRTWQVEHNTRQAEFRAGTIPTDLPDGPYDGSSPSLERGSWHGKSFDRAKATGLNRVGDGEKYPFAMYFGRGLRDPIKVITIDYNHPSNPWWLRLVTDEIVQTSPNHFLGKIQVRILGLTFSVGYFELKK
jgi:hypothetical protein